MVSDTDENDEEGVGKKYIVRIMCQNKFLFVEFSEDELNILRFPEKGRNDVICRKIIE